jgi:hypothetical protein
MNHYEHELDLLSITASLERKSVKVGLLSESLPHRRTRKTSCFLALTPQVSFLLKKKPEKPLQEHPKIIEAILVLKLGDIL